MALISGSIPNLINGVSQQPDALALPTQGRLQENAYSTVIEGLAKRPPSLHVAVLDVSAGSRFFPLVRGDGVEEYLACVEPGGQIRVFDTAGVERTVNAPDGWGYVSAGGLGVEAIRTRTVVDYTFVMNTTVKASLMADTVPARQAEALVVVRSGTYGRTYKIKINGDVVASYTTPEGGENNQSPRLDAGHIARSLMSGRGALVVHEGEAFTANLHDSGISTENGWTVQTYDHVIYIRRYGADFTISVEDGDGGTRVSSVKDEVQQFQDLPMKGRTGMKVKVAGDPSLTSDGYWVEFKSEGTWVETCAPGIRYKLDPASMPHVLVREADGTFTFRRFTWAERKVGDDDTNPAPSIVGEALTDIGFGRGRLILVRRDGATLSEADAFENLWRTTVTALIDSDPIDVAANASSGTINHVLSFGDDIHLWSSNVQFRLGGGDILTPKSVSIKPSTDYRMSAKVRPTVSGESVFFAFEGAQWAQLWEFMIPPEAERGVARSVTDHVPRYIPAGVRRIVSLPEHGVTVAHTSGDPAGLYVYKAHWINNEKLQSAWSRWTFPGVTEILDVLVFGDFLYTTAVSFGSVVLSKLPIDPGFRDDGGDVVLHLDRRAALTGTYGPATRTTSFVLPYDVPTSNTAIVAVDDAGRPQEIIARTNTVLTLAGDLGERTIYFGFPYAYRYIPATPRLRQRGAEGAGPAILTGRLQIRYMSFNYFRTGTFDVIVRPRGRPASVYRFSGRVLADPSNILGQPSLDDGSFRIPVMCRNDDVEIEIVSTSHMPVRLMSADWEATYTSRSRKV